MTRHARNLSSLSRRARREWEQDERQDRSAAFAASIIEARRNARKCLVGLGVALGAIGEWCARWHERQADVIDCPFCGAHAVIRADGYCQACRKDLTAEDLEES